MSYTNRTPNFDLPQWIGTDKPTFLGDFNSAFSAIDTAMKNNEDAAAAAVGTANAASATATSANTNANTALNTANTAKTSADAATAAAASATTTANAAQTTANSAARTAQANNIENLAPAYDPTLTYNVGDLVTYVDAQNSGKLYKCIIAVNTPMEFNVNYWDDVTCSEVFDTPDKLFCEVTATASDTNATLMQKIVDAGYLALTLAEKINSYMVQIAADNSAYYKYEPERARTNDVIFERVNITSTKIVHDQITLSTNSANTKVIENTVEDTGFATSDLSASAPNEGFKVRIYLKD